MNGIADCCSGAPGGLGRAEARRLKVIDAARKLFADHGFHATGMAQLSRESGVAIGQIYRDFASKEEIVAEIVHRDCAAFLDDIALRGAIARQDAAAVRDWLLRLVEPDPDDNDGDLIAEIIAESSRNARIADIFFSIQHDFRANILAALSVFAPGEEATARRGVLADTILTLSIGLLHHRLVRSDETLAELVAALKRMLGREIDDMAREVQAIDS